MKIKIDKIHDRYAFLIEKNNGKVIYASSEQFFLIPFVKSSYKYAWEAYRDAKKIPTYHVASLDKISGDEFVSPVVVDVSAESMLEDHYNNILEDIDDKARSADKDEDKEAVYEEVKMITTELLTIEKTLDKDEDKEKITKMISYLRKITKKYFSDLLEEDKKEKEEKEGSGGLGDMGNLGGLEGLEGLGELMPVNQPPMATASKKNILADEKFVKNVLDEYAERACKAIQEKNPDAIFDINIDDREIEIAVKDKPILILKVGENMMLEDILPKGDLSSIYPYHKSIFYQKYWKPIVESIGHVLVNDSILIVNGKTVLPDLPKEPKSFTINGWNMDKNREENIDVSFRGKDKDSIWIFLPTKSEKIITSNTQNDSSNAIVRCINPKLKSLQQVTGIIVQELRDSQEVDVNWGRGLGIQRMSIKDVEKVIK